MRNFALSLAVAGALTAFAAVPAFAGPTLTLDLSEGSQPSNVGIITVTQDGTDAVTIDLTFSDPKYGILVSGTHVPFGFQLNSAGLMGTLSIPTLTFLHPPAGTYSNGTFTLGGAGSQPGFGSFDVTLADSAKDGSSKAYYGELEFTLDSTAALDTTDFVTNTNGFYFTADLTDGSNTGAQGWYCATGHDCGSPPKVPEPSTILLFGSVLAALGLLRRRVLSKSV